MPRRPCIRCGRLTTSGSYCTTHRPKKKSWSERLTTEPWRAIYGTQEWKNARASVLRRDNYQCLLCGSSADVTVDHITPLRLGGAPYDPNNLQTLCRTHHGQVEGKRRKKQ